MNKLIVILVLVLILCGCVRASDPNSPSCMVLSWPFNDDGVRMRIGSAGVRTEFGVQVGYRDDFLPDQLEAYTLGLYFQWIANPNGQFPIGGWFPDSWQDDIPGLIPVSLYVGLWGDYEFEDHNILGGPSVGFQINTGENVSLGCEFDYNGLQELFPDDAAATTDDWTVWFVPKILWR